MARSRAPPEDPAARLPPRVRQRMRDTAVGRVVAYKGEGEWRCRLGKVLSIAEDLSSLTVHVYMAEVDGRLQVKWLPAFDSQEGADYQTQRKETVEAKRVLATVTLNNGVLNHASASQLSRAGWRLDEGTVQHGALVAAVGGPLGAPPPPACLSDQPSGRVGALLSACRPEKDLDIRVGEVQAWANGAPLFVEVFDGQRRLSQAIRALSAFPGDPACVVVAGVDMNRRTYGQSWDLSKARDRGRLRYLFFQVLKAAGAHWALPCSKWSSLGSHSPDPAAFALASFTMDGLEHLHAAGCLTSFEGPRSHGLVSSPEWEARFGVPSDEWRDVGARPAPGSWEYVFPTAACSGAGARTRCRWPCRSATS